MSGKNISFSLGIRNENWIMFFNVIEQLIFVFVVCMKLVKCRLTEAYVSCNINFLGSSRHVGLHDFFMMIRKISISKKDCVGLYFEVHRMPIHRWWFIGPNFLLGRFFFKFSSVRSVKHFNWDRKQNFLIGFNSFTWRFKKKFVEI